MFLSFGFACVFRFLVVDFSVPVRCFFGFVCALGFLCLDFGFRVLGLRVLLV